MKHLTSLLLTLLSALGTLTSAGADDTNKAELPNIVWLVSEDDSADYLRLYHKDGAPMPNVEQLAKQGLVFNHAFSNAPVCSVARSTIISGCYAPRTFTQFHRRAVSVPMPAGLRMFPAYLREAGYFTSNNSKEDYNFTKGPDVWDLSSKNASYRKRQPGQPFFHVQNFGTTHEGQLHFSEESISTKTTTDPKTVPVYPFHPDTPLFRYTNAKYRDLHRTLDNQIGDFLKQLENDGLRENTIIFYYGDHGGVLPGSKGYIYERGLRVPMVVSVPEKWQHLFPAKAGSRIDGFVQFIDLAPTVLNLAGVNIPAQIDGRPFLGRNVTLEDLNSRDTAFSYADRFDEKYDLVRALRKGNFKYIRNFTPFNFDGLQNNYRYHQAAYREWRDLYKAGKLTTEQAQFFKPRPAEALYDLASDPFELRNLAADPARTGVLVDMRKALHNQMISMPDLSFFPEPVLIKEAAKNPVAFGQKNKARIAKLAAVADLALVPFDQARPALEKALKSDDPIERQRALTTCSTFGQKASSFADQIKTLATSDPDNLVKMRAAEFLGLTRLADPRPLLTDCLKAATGLDEAALILNTITLLHDSDPGYRFTLDPSIVNPQWLKKKNSNVRLRFDYLQQP